MPRTSSNTLPSTELNVSDLLLSLLGAVTLVGADFLLIDWLLR